MTRIPNGPQIALGTLVFILIFSIGACDDGDDKEATASPVILPTESPSPAKPVEDVTITIGSVTDKTGMASSALTIVDMALTDVIGYFNDNDLIP